MKFKMTANDDEILGHVVRSGVKGHLYQRVIISRMHTTLLKSYLANRNQRVLINESES